jgi:MFS transporter, DHA1 family, multidrug resistance protein
VGELPLLGTVIGAFVGSLVIVFDSRRKAKQVKAGKELKPEDRLHPALFGGLSFAVSMFWLAWSAEYK